MSSKSTVIVDIQAQPGKGAQLADILGMAIQKTIAKPNCWRATLMIDDDDPDHLVMHQEWRDHSFHKAYVDELMADEKMAHVMKTLMTRPPKSTYLNDCAFGLGEWGGPQHLEICSADTDATRDFLTNVFGWTFASWMEGYEGFLTPGFLMGGLRPKMDEEPAPQTVPYLIVDDLEDRMAAVQAAGGTVTVPIQEVPDAGRFFWFIAPGGLQLAVWESKTP